MKVLKVLWGLIVDDTRLASVLLLSLVIASVVAVRYPLLGAVVIWVGLIGALWISIEHQLKQKVASQRK